MKAKKPKRDRTLRREAERGAARIASAQEALARLEAGGSPDRPLRVESAAQIEVQARSLHCPVCGDGYRVLEHEAQIVGGVALRVVTVLSPQCGRRRVLYFSIEPPRPN
jgi:hypothetical protein